jgi:predicted AAA+ superfamily ATPase
MSSPQVGALFETLVLAEIVKFMQNYGKDWELFFWRTKDGEEIDFVVKTANGTIYALDAKLSMQGTPQTVTYPPTFKKYLSPQQPLIIVTYDGQKLKLSPSCISLPISELHDYLKEI